MDLTKKILLPLGVVALVGACAPYPPEPYRDPQLPPAPPSEEQSMTNEQQRQLEESRRRLAREREAQNNNDNNTAPAPPKPNKPNYPTASAVPGKEGFVFNPYTHNIVDVKGIGSGKLCRDPEDSDPTHKFRVP